MANDDQEKFWAMWLAVSAAVETAASKHGLDLSKFRFDVIALIKSVADGEITLVDSPFHSFGKKDHSRDNALRIIQKDDARIFCEEMKKALESK